MDGVQLMSRERLAAAYEALAEAYGQVAHELRSNDSAPVRADVPAAGVSAPTAPAPADTQAAHVNAALGVCPTHRTAWTVKQGGISKAGKPYSAFWKCSQKDADGYCPQKPVKAWTDSHPIAEDVPF